MKTKNYLPFIGHPSELGYLLGNKGLKASLEAIAASDNPELKPHKDAIVASRTLSSAANHAAGKGLQVGELVSLSEGVLAIARLFYARFVTHVSDADCSATLGGCSISDEHRRFHNQAALFKGDVERVIKLAREIIKGADTFFRRRLRRPISEEHLKEMTSHDGVFGSWFQTLMLADSNTAHWHGGLRDALKVDVEGNIGEYESLPLAILNPSTVAPRSAPPVFPTWTSNGPPKTWADNVDDNEAKDVAPLSGTVNRQPVVDSDVLMEGPASDVTMSPSAVENDGGGSVSGSNHSSPLDSRVSPAPPGPANTFDQLRAWIRSGAPKGSRASTDSSASQQSRASMQSRGSTKSHASHKSNSSSIPDVPKMPVHLKSRRERSR